VGAANRASPVPLHWWSGSRSGCSKQPDSTGNDGPYPADQQGSSRAVVRDCGLRSAPSMASVSWVDPVNREDSAVVFVTRRIVPAAGLIPATWPNHVESWWALCPTRRVAARCGDRVVAGGGAQQLAVGAVGGKELLLGVVEDSSMNPDLSSWSATGLCLRSSMGRCLDVWWTCARRGLTDSWLRRRLRIWRWC